MNEIITQFKDVLPVGQDNQFPINARDLYRTLQVGRDFSTWIKVRLNDLDSRENVDYSPNLGRLTDSLTPTNKIDYHLTLSLAKEIAMLERNAVGKQVRRYFIQCEEQLKTQTRIMPNWYQRMTTNKQGLPDGYFSVSSQAYQVYKLLEEHGYTIPDYADDGKTILLEGSLGYWWLQYLEQCYPQYTSSIRSYLHTPLKGESIRAKCYPEELLGFFVIFVKRGWVPRQAVRYLSERTTANIETLKALPLGH